MIRLIVLDTSGLYSSIYDEIYCSKKDLYKYEEKYSDDKYVCVKITYKVKPVTLVYSGLAV